MLTAWLVCSVLMGVCGMLGELRKGSTALVAIAGFVFSFVLWPVLILWFLFSMVIMVWYVVEMKFF